MAYDCKQDTLFLGEVEGFFERGYIPCWIAGTGKKKSKNYFGIGSPDGVVPMYSSGVTVGIGCDLGQTTEAYLDEYGVNRKLVVEYLRPYIGLKKTAAAEMLHRKELTLSYADAMALSEAVHAGYIERFVIPGYNRDAKISFALLPKPAQICIVSMCYQKGVGGVRRDFKNTWAALCRCDWKDAYNRLTNASLWSAFQGRRKQEGELLKPLL